MCNCDWDPVCLQQLFAEDLWSSNVSDLELLHKVEEMERYCPITEDISMEDELLCSAVERFETE